MGQQEELGRALEVNTGEGETSDPKDTAEETVVALETRIPPGIKSILQAISGAVHNEKLTTREARELRARLGISQAYFTRKQRTPTERKVRSKIQKASRKANRRHVKGIVNRKGQKFHLQA